MGRGNLGSENSTYGGPGTRRTHLIKRLKEGQCGCEQQGKRKARAVEKDHVTQNAIKHIKDFTFLLQSSGKLKVIDKEVMLKFEIWTELK